MKTFIRRTSLAGFAGIAGAFACSSCSLPPREAWHHIQRDGLIGFLANQCHAPAATSPKNLALTPTKVPVTPARTVIASDSERFVGPPGPTAVPPKPAAPAITQPKTAAPRPADTTPSVVTAAEKPLVATSVPSLPGFVRSPYTIPPRLVDAKGSAPGATMVCPYTQRPFVLPPDFVSQPAAVAASDAAPATATPLAQPPATAPKNGAPATSPSTPTMPKGGTAGTQPPAQEPPKVALKGNAPGSPPPPASAPPAAAPKNGAPSTAPPATKPTVAAPKESSPGMRPPAANPPATALFGSKPANATPPAAGAPAAKPAAPEVPYGVPIPNRPGFVNSPFAAKHQLVDVTGLPVGMEVKCPYTGKLFRVPAMDIADQKAVASPGAPPAPEKAGKK